MSTQTDFAQPAQSAAMESMNAFLGGLESQLGKSLDPLTDLAKKLGTSGTQKSIKGFGGVLKGMGGATIKGWALMQVMLLIEPFMKLLKLLEIPLKAVGILFTLFTTNILIPLLPLFLNFTNQLLELAPIFLMLGTLVADLLFPVFAALFDILGPLLELLAPLVEMLIGRFGPAFALIGSLVTQLLVALMPLIELLVAILIPVMFMLAPILELTSSLMLLLTDVLGNLLIVGIKSLVDGIVWLATTIAEWFGKDGKMQDGIKSFFGGVKNIVNGIIGSVNSVITSVNDFLGSNINTLPTLAQGGLAFGPTLAVVGDNPNPRSNPEVIAPLDQLQGMLGNTEMVEALEENNDLQRQNLHVQTRLVELLELNAWQT